MKGALIALFIGLAFLVFLYFKMDIYRSKRTIDVHFHDTYFVLSYVSVIVFVLLFLGTFFSVEGIIGTFFKSKLFWVLAVLFLSIDAYYIVTFYKTFNNTKSLSFQTNDHALSDAAIGFQKYTQQNIFRMKRMSILLQQWSKATEPECVYRLRPLYVADIPQY